MEFDYKALSPSVRFIRFEPSPDSLKLEANLQTTVHLMFGDVCFSFQTKNNETTTTIYFAFSFEFAWRPFQLDCQLVYLSLSLLLFHFSGAKFYEKKVCFVPRTPRFSFRFGFSFASFSCLPSNLTFCCLYAYASLSYYSWILGSLSLSPIFSVFLSLCPDRTPVAACSLCAPFFCTLNVDAVAF